MNIFTRAPDKLFIKGVNTPCYFVVKGICSLKKKIARPLSAVGRAMAYGAWGREFDPWARRVLRNDLIDDISCGEVVSYLQRTGFVLVRDPGTLDR